MSTTTIDKEHSLSINRFIKAPRERVFAAWTNPEDIVKWWGPGVSYAISAKVDPRPGGAFHVTMQTTENGVMKINGIYREVTPPSKLVFTWSWESRPGETLVTVEFTEVQGGTSLTLTHEGFVDAETRDNHNWGWNGALDKLECRAEGNECSVPGNFNWNELLTTDVDGAKSFYTKLFGWETVPMPGGMPYTILKKDGGDVGGLMKSPVPGAPAQWVAYVSVANTDKSAKSATALGAKIVVPPFDIPKIGRIALLQDPQGATFGLFQPVAG
ncbi:MAG: SRPBCC domain-containing protein [Chthoniobacteraceae bacterium]